MSEISTLKKVLDTDGRQTLRSLFTVQEGEYHVPASVLNDENVAWKEHTKAKAARSRALMASQTISSRSIEAAMRREIKIRAMAEIGITRQADISVLLNLGSEEFRNYIAWKKIQAELGVASLLRAPTDQPEMVTTPVVTETVIEIIAQPVIEVCEVAAAEPLGNALLANGLESDIMKTEVEVVPAKNEVGTVPDDFYSGLIYDPLTILQKSMGMSPVIAAAPGICTERELFDIEPQTVVADTESQPNGVKIGTGVAWGDIVDEYEEREEDTSTIVVDNVIPIPFDRDARTARLVRAAVETGRDIVIANIHNPDNVDMLPSSQKLKRMLDISKNVTPNRRERRVLNLYRKEERRIKSMYMRTFAWSEIAGELQGVHEYNLTTRKVDLVGGLYVKGVITSIAASDAIAPPVMEVSRGNYNYRYGWSNKCDEDLDFERTITEFVASTVEIDCDMVDVATISAESILTPGDGGVTLTSNQTTHTSKCDVCELCGQEQDVDDVCCFTACASLVSDTMSPIALADATDSVTVVCDIKTGVSVMDRVYLLERQFASICERLGMTERSGGASVIDRLALLEAYVAKINGELGLANSIAEVGGAFRPPLSTRASSFARGRGSVRSRSISQSDSSASPSRNRSRSRQSDFCIETPTASRTAASPGPRASTAGGVSATVGVAEMLEMPAMSRNVQMIEKEVFEALRPLPPTSQRVIRRLKGRITKARADLQDDITATLKERNNMSMQRHEDRRVAIDKSELNFIEKDVLKGDSVALMERELAEYMADAASQKASLLNQFTIKEFDAKFSRYEINHSSEFALSPCERGLVGMRPHLRKRILAAAATALGAGVLIAGSYLLVSVRHDVDDQNERITSEEVSSDVVSDGDYAPVDGMTRDVEHVDIMRTEAMEEIMGRSTTDEIKICMQELVFKMDREDLIALGSVSRVVGFAADEAKYMVDSLLPETISLSINGPSDGEFAPLGGRADRYVDDTPTVLNVRRA